MKKFVRLLVLTICILMFSIPVFASSNIKVQLNGEIVDFTDANGNKVESQIVNNRTMVPMRKIFEVLGADVEWNGETRSIKASTEELEIGLQINNNVATVKDKSGEIKEITLDSAPVIINNRTLVPVRFIAESLNKKVGWDAKNKAVIVIDPVKIENIIKSESPNLYNFLSLNTKEINTYDMNMDLNGNIESMFQNEMTTVDFDGEMEIKVSEKAIAINIDLEASGSEKAIESIGFEKVNIQIILDGEKEEAYIKSELIENSEGRWVRYEFDEEQKAEFRELFNSAKIPATVGNIDSFVDSVIPEESLTLNYYAELETAIKMITQIMGNDNLKITGTKDKTVKFEVDLKDIIKLTRPDITSKEEKELLETMEFNFELESKIEDGISKESSINFVLGQEGSMRMDLKLDCEFESYNENINIQIPNGSNVVNEKDIRKLSSEAIRMDFMLFRTTLSTVELSMSSEAMSVQGKEAIKSNNKSRAQIYNYIARGNYDILGENGWLSDEEANNIACTLINAEYAERSLGYGLPDRNVETENGEEKVLYYVTPKGAVFAWPPYEYNGKSYVTTISTIVDEKGNELTFKEAMKIKRGVIYLKDTEEVIIVKNGNSVIFEKGSKNDYVYNTANYVNDNTLVKSFYSFQSQLNDLEWDIEREVEKIKNQFKEKTKLQVYDYFARGKDLVIKTENDWITSNEENNIVCIKIDEVYAEYTLGEDLPNIKVDTYQKDDVQVSFYITPKGQVFCWPPFENAGKSYIDNNTTAKDINGNELSNLAATKENKVVLYFKDTNEIIIVKNGSKTTFEKGNINDVVFTEVNDRSTFDSEMYDLENDIRNVSYSINEIEENRGNSRSYAQIYNFMARGGYDVLPQTADGDMKWLTEKDADKIACTKIDEKYVINVLGRPLPNITVDTSKGNKEKVSFFITSDGDVFCWPPFEAEGKAYVKSFTTVKDDNRNELSAIEATKLDQVKINVGYYNTIVISNETGIKPVSYTKNYGNIDNIGVWYYEKGSVEGIDFNNYFNSIPGDANNDGAIDNEDVILIEKYVSDKRIELDEANADVNGDKKISSKDVVIVKSYIDKKINKLPHECKFENEKCVCGLEDKIVYGDANEDGDINHYDTNLISAYLRGSLKESINLKNADVNLNGEIDECDSFLISVSMWKNLSLPHKCTDYTIEYVPHKDGKSHDINEKCACGEARITFNSQHIYENDKCKYCGYKNK